MYAFTCTKVIHVCIYIYTKFESNRLSNRFTPEQISRSRLEFRLKQKNVFHAREQSRLYYIVYIRDTASSRFSHGHLRAYPFLSSLPFTLKFTTVAHSTKFHESRQLFALKRNSISGEFLNVHSWFV